MSANAGDTGKAADHNRDVKRLVAYGERVTDSTGAAAAQSVLRLDDIPTTAARRYRISCNNLLMTSSVAADVPSARLAYTTDGTSPTTASTLFAIANGAAVPTAGTTNGVAGSLSRDYTSAAGEALSVLLYTTRLSGTGLVKLLAASGANPITLTVEDLGPDTGDIGTEL